MTLEVEQKERLLKAKLVALVRALVSDEPKVSQGPEVRGEVAALAVEDHGYLLLGVGSPSGVAAGVLWATRNGCSILTILADESAAAAARFGGYFSSPGLSIEVREIRAADSVPVVAEPLPTESAAPTDAGQLIDQLERSGLEVVVEHGSVRGEVLGLEVARLVRWNADTGGDGELHLEPGVGRFDRDAVAAVNPDAPPDEALAQTVEAVRRYRYDGAPSHPVAMMCRERWIRADLINDPSLIGAERLTAVEMTLESGGIRDRHPAGAVGVDESGGPIVVVASSGVDLALVPLSADLRARTSPEARLILALPAQDLHPATIALASLLTPAAETHAVPAGWG